MNTLTSFFKDKPTSKIIDVASGSGQFIKTLSPVFPNAEFFGTEPDPISLEKARNAWQGKSVTFFQMKADSLGFGDNVFDVVSISNALHHLPNLKDSFAEMKRVLKPGGYFIISELRSDNLDPAQENQKFYHHMRSFTDRKAGVYHHETWAKDEIIEMVKHNGILPELVFDHFDGKDFITESEPVDFWVEKFKSFIETLKGLPEYEEFLPKVDEFKRRIEKDGMKHATNVVIVGSKQ
jgi:ubiquinone/menaquinone biosynthesis C-methylase UbiE